MQKSREKYVLSYGGGVNSTALMLLLIEQKARLDEVVFADTGAEMPETYRYLEVARDYLNKHGLTLQLVHSKNGTLLETCQRRKVIPSEVWRWSTRDYKITPIYAYYRTIASRVYQYVGLARDEIERVKPSKAHYVTNLYPLIEAGYTREDCLRKIAAARLPIPVKSGCFFCPFNNIERWTYLYRNHRDLFMKAQALEEGSKHFPKQKLTRLTLRGLRNRFEQRDLSPIQKIEIPCGGECMT